MAMRELVSGGAACAVPGSSSSANPLGALANALIGSSSKTKERLEEVPTASPVDLLQPQPPQLPGSELLHPPSAHGSDFIAAFRQNALTDAWNDIHPTSTPSTFDGPPQAVLSNFLHSFVHTGRGGVPFRPAPLPVLGLSDSDKHCIRDRSTIMARHIFAHQGDHFINAQLDALFSSLDIDAPANQSLPARMRDLDRYWNDSQPKPAFQASDAWVAEFTNQPHPNAWADDFQRHHGPAAWVSEFDQEQSQLASLDHQMGGPDVATFAAMEQSRMLANTLAQNHDPKFQNSKFLQFVSKMSRGELTIEDNQVKQTAGTSIDWAAEYQQQYDAGSSWANEFVSRGTDRWVNEFTSGEANHAPLEEQWVDEFSNLQINDWADEFGKQVGEGAFGEATSESWANAYDEYMNEQVAAKQRSEASRGVYEFSDMNPYVGHPNPLKEGQELFRKGLLSEAVLALEAEVLKNPDNAEGWRLLGIAHAENDDDQQAIAAMMRAQEADPTNLEVLLSLGVSHTNELEQAAALKYLYGWLRHHPKYGALAPPELADSLYYADVARLFNDAAQMSPEDADVHVVLGVLYNLSREYDKAIESFQTALKLKPRDYSLWNKLGATQANSIQSADAILAYQQALDLKPNYVRAWANMGISYANQGMHEDSIRYYVRALALNSKADNAWQYLRISLSCADRSDMLEACDSRNLDVLQKEFPL